MVKSKHIDMLRCLFLNSVAKLKSKELISKNIVYNHNTQVLSVFDDKFNLARKNLYVVGAGKAVLQMAIEIENILCEKISGSIISVPCGITKECPLPQTSKIEYIEGAENNIPDEDSLLATQKIKQLVKSLDANSLLIVLLSGGGSALLPDPIQPITLKEKSELIKYLSYQGADIKELNTIRKRLSAIKGGKLATLAYPAEVVTLLISDIVGVCPDMVASGPTFKNQDSPQDAVNIVQKYMDIKDVPSSIYNILTNNNTFDDQLWKVVKVSNYVLGNNVVLVEGACSEAKKYGISSFHVSHVVTGNVDNVSHDYCQLVIIICKMLTKKITSSQAADLIKSLNNISVREEFLKDLMNISSSKNMCLISSGEPVVKVVGKGKGGRNQHLALQFSNKLNIAKSNNIELLMFDICLLSAGTDGMDGPTDCAGAIGYSDLVDDATKEKLDVNTYLENCDSYNFFSKFMNGKYHIKIGHTNTNVMDLHIISIQPKNTGNLRRCKFL